MYLNVLVILNGLFNLASYYVLIVIIYALPFKEHVKVFAGQSVANSKYFIPVGLICNKGSFNEIKKS